MLVLVESGGGVSLKTGVFAGRKSLKGTLVPVGDSDLNERNENLKFFLYCYYCTQEQESQLKS